MKSIGWRDGTSHSYGEARDRFVVEHLPRIKASSAKRYVQSLLALDPFVAELAVDEISSAALSAFETARRREGVTDATIRRDLSCLSALLRCCQEWEWVTGNAAAAYLRLASRRGLRESEPRTRYLGLEEEEAILAEVALRRSAAKGNRDRHGYMMLGAAIMLAIDTGLRREELHGLTWTDVDLHARELHVAAARAKSGRHRAVPILPRSLAVLEHLPRSKHSAFVLWHGDGRRYFDLSRQLDRLTSDLGIADLRWHDLRRTCGCRLLQDHVFPLERVSRWLGHSSVTLTERSYAFLDVRHLHKALADSHKSTHSEIAGPVDRSIKSLNLFGWGTRIRT